jgi:V8-like Glu-specific endopeptidase
MRAALKHLPGLGLLVAALVFLTFNTPDRAQLTDSSAPGTLFSFHDQNGQWYRCSGERIGENTWLTARHCAAKRDGGFYVEKNGSTIIESRAHYIVRQPGQTLQDRVLTDVAVIGDRRDVQLTIGDLTQSYARGENGLIIVRAWQDDGKWHECRTRLQDAEWYNGNWNIQCRLRPGASGAVVWYVRDAEKYLASHGTGTSPTGPESAVGVTEAALETWRRPGMEAVGVISTASSSGWNSISGMQIVVDLLGRTAQ